MIVKDDKGNELLEVIQVEETLVGKQYNPVNHALAVVKVGDDYLMGWNRYRKKLGNFWRLQRRERNHQRVYYQGMSGGTGN